MERKRYGSGAAVRALCALAAAGTLVILAAGCGGPHTSGHAAVREKLMLADRLIQAESYTEAISVLTAAIKNDPKNPEAYYYLGIAYFYQNQFPESEKALKESLRLEPRNPDAHNVLGLVYKQMGKKEEALGEYRTALADPTYQQRENALLNLGVCLDDMGKTDEAISDLRQAVELNPKYYAAHYELAKMLDKQDQTREAITEYEVAAPAFNSDPNYHYRLGMAYFRDNNIDRAREQLNKVVAALPGSEKALKARELLDLMGPAPGGSAPPPGAAAPPRP